MLKIRHVVWGFSVCALLIPQAEAQCFKNVTQALGADFVHEASAQAGNMDGGMAWLDVDGDGDDDLFLTSGKGSHKLLRWDGGFFTDVTDGAGLPAPKGVFGVAAADYDDDGLPDLYLTVGGPNVLLHNDGNCTFSDVTAQYGVAGNELTTAASWADFDRDGDLDLYVGNYIQVSTVPFKEGWPNRLYVNVGSASAPEFVDMAAELDVQDVGAFGPPPEGYVNPKEGQPVAGCCLSVSTLDYDDDGDADILVGNDFGVFVLRNRLYRNDSPVGGPLVFTDVSDETLFSSYPQFNMGINGADYDGDGDWDLYLSNLGPNALLRNDDGVYVNVVDEAGPVEGYDPTGELARTSWDSDWMDYDNDGWEDLFVVNGYVPGGEDLIPGQQEVESPNALWHNLGNGTFELVSPDPCPVDNMRVGKGAKFTDLDGDGGLELYLVNNGTQFFGQTGNQIGFTTGCKSKLYRCRPVAGNAWAEFRLKGTRSNVEALGARVDAQVGARLLRRQVRSDSVYVTTPSRLVHFGLGRATGIDTLVVRWPSGTYQELHALAPNQVRVLVEPDVVLADVARPLPTPDGTQLGVTLENLDAQPHDWHLAVTLSQDGQELFGATLEGTLEGGGLATPTVLSPVDPTGLELSVRVIDGATRALDERLLQL